MGFQYLFFDAGLSVVLVMAIAMILGAFFFMRVKKKINVVAELNLYMVIFFTFSVVDFFCRMHDVEVLNLFLLRSLSADMMFLMGVTVIVSILSMLFNWMAASIALSKKKYASFSDSDIEQESYYGCSRVEDLMKDVHSADGKKFPPEIISFSDGRIYFLKGNDLYPKEEGCSGLAEKYNTRPEAKSENRSEIAEDLALKVNKLQIDVSNLTDRMALILQMMKNLLDKIDANNSLK